MNSHRDIMINAATAVKNSTAVLDYCVTHFGRGLEICVGAYASGIPTEDNSPFLWLYASGENEQVATDQTFDVSCVVGGCVKNAEGSQYITTEVEPRTESANGLIVNGGNKIVEDLRDMIIDIIINARSGAIVNRVSKTENDIAHYPLEWAEFVVKYNEYETL